jgi:hypothetical protein
MKDKAIQCQECRQEFVWTAGEQDFYATKNLDEPKFCMICRAKKQAEERFWQRN